MHTFKYAVTLFCRKQIEMLEENMKSLESRLRNENRSVEEYYLKKINTLESDYTDIVKKYHAEIEELSKVHENIQQKARKNYEQEIETIRTEHQGMIENIRQSKLLEFSVVQENGSYLATLKNASSYLENASDNLQALRTDMEDKIERLHKEREIQLEVREKRLEGSTFFFLLFF